MTEPGNRIYLLNSPVITGYGDWRFEGPLAVERAREIVAHGFTSAIGHEGAAQLLGKLLDIEVSVNRATIDMQPRDVALVLRLKNRLPEGAILTQEEMEQLPFEMGLLTRLT